MDDVKRIIKASVNHVAYPNCTIKPKNWLKKLRSNVRDLNVKARKLVHWKRLLRSQLLGRCVRSFTDQEATIQLCNLSVANIDTHTCSALSGRLWKKKKKNFSCFKLHVRLTWGYCKSHPCPNCAKYSQNYSILFEDFYSKPSLILGGSFSKFQH